jgi:HlyD family secretion protein
MDRPIPDRRRRRLLARRAFPALVAAGAAVCVLVALPGWIRPSVRASEIRTAIVGRGPVEATLTASGTVVPQYESVVVSPVDTRVARILRKPGDPVAPGEPIVVLETGEAEAELRKLDDQIALKKNERERARLALENTLTDLRAQREVKGLERKSLEIEVRRDSALVETGVISRDAARVAETSLERVAIEIGKIDGSMDNARRELEARLRGLDLETSILERDREEAARRLKRAGASSDRGGVVTWVVPTEGGAVSRGEEIARVADLGAFRIEATLSDVHSERLARGMPVRVRVGGEFLTGRVEIVRPAVDNGVLTADVSLDDPSTPGLRPNLRVDVYVVTDNKEDALRVKRGATVAVDGGQAVFVVRGDRAVRTPVAFGICSFDSCEVLSGLSPGDSIILSDMTGFTHAREVRIR